jgi:hypothetical protein
MKKLPHGLAQAYMGIIQQALVLQQKGPLYGNNEVELSCLSLIDDQKGLLGRKEKSKKAELAQDGRLGTIRGSRGGR